MDGFSKTFFMQFNTMLNTSTFSGILIYKIKPLNEMTNFRSLGRLKHISRLPFVVRVYLRIKHLPGRTTGHSYNSRWLMVLEFIL